MTLQSKVDNLRIVERPFGTGDELAHKRTPGRVLKLESSVHGAPVPTWIGEFFERDARGFMTSQGTAEITGEQIRKEWVAVQSSIPARHERLAKDRRRIEARDRAAKQKANRALRRARGAFGQLETRKPTTVKSAKRNLERAEKLAIQMGAAITHPKGRPPVATVPFDEHEERYVQAILNRLHARVVELEAAPKRGRGRPKELAFGRDLEALAWRKVPSKFRTKVPEPAIQAGSLAADLTRDRKHAPLLRGLGSAMVPLSSLSDEQLEAVIEIRRKIPKLTIEKAPVRMTWERGRWQAQIDFTHAPTHPLAPGLFATGKTPAEAVKTLRGRVRDAKRRAKALKRFDQKLAAAVKACEKGGCTADDIRRRLERSRP